MKKTLLKTIYHLGAFAPFHWAMREQVLILTYHRFSSAENPSKISSAEFAAHLEYLGKHNRVLSLADATYAMRNGKPLPRGATVITIDDGYADAYEIAFPVLKRFGLPATLFVITDFLDEKCWLWTDLMRYVLLETKSGNLSVEFETDEKIEAKLADKQHRLEIASRVNARLKKMPDDKKDAKIKELADALNVKIPALPTLDYAPVTLEQAREMDANCLSIESHTVTHPILTNIEQTRLDDELQISKQRLETILGRAVEHFCYPNGSFNEQVRQSVERAGYKSAVTTDYGFNKTSANQFALNRIDALPAIENFAQSASGFEALRGTPSS